MNLLGNIDSSERVIIPVAPSDRFARKIAKELKQIWKTDTLISHIQHPDGDYDPKLLLEQEGFNVEPRNRLKDKHVYLVLGHKTSWEPSLMFERIFHTASLCRENGAKTISLIWGNIRMSGNHLRDGVNNKFSQKDIEKYDGKALSTTRFARMCKFEGIENVITLHTHSKNMIETFGEIYFNDISRGAEVFKDLPIAPIVAHHLIISGKVRGNGSNAVFLSTDEGSRNLATDIIKNIKALDPSINDISWVQFRKDRDPQTGFLKEIKQYANSENYVGHENKDKFIFDDIVRSFSSMYGVIEKLGGNNYTMFATHAHLTGRSQNLLRSDSIKNIIFTNTMTRNLEDPYYEHQLFEKTTVLKIGKYFSNAILNIVEDKNDPEEFYTAQSPADMAKIGHLYAERTPI